MAEQHVLAETVERVTCRWCGAADAVELAPRLGGAAATAAPVDPAATTAPVDPAATAAPVDPAATTAPPETVS